MKKITLAVIFMFYILAVEVLYAQVSLRQIPLLQQVEQSNLIIEGKVISKKSYWDLNRKNIYTSNVIEVYKVFKGKNVKYVDVITLGGIVGLTAQNSSHSLQLAKGAEGVFMLKLTSKLGLQNKGVQGISKFEAYSGIQGFYGYNKNLNKARNIFKSYDDIENNFHKKVEGITHRKVIQIKKNSIEKRKTKSQLNKAALPVGITNISPTSLAAGVGDQLTITGSGFGSIPGTIGFANANDGGASLTSEIMPPGTPVPLPSQIISWNENTIVVEVPSQAGTGSVTVFHNSDGTQATSSQTLTVTYSETNVINGGEAYQVQHIDDNGNGGYTWEMQTNFFNETEPLLMGTPIGKKGYKAAFETALDKWRCETKINWVISSSAATEDVIEDDGVNVIRFDNGSELPNGVLGRCTSRYKGCFTGGTPDINWFVYEMDIEFDDGENWFFGTGLPNNGIDFESVALHELGHGHQLDHVIDSTFDGDNLDDVMHFSLSPLEQQRVLSSENITAANSIQGRSTSINPCPNPVNPPDPDFPTSITTNSSTCNLSIDEDQLDTAISVFPNPANGQFQIKNTSFINLEKAVIYDISGREISSYDLKNTSRTKTINMFNVSSGVYFVNIFSERAMITRKVVLK